MSRLFSWRGRRKNVILLAITVCLSLAMLSLPDPAQVSFASAVTTTLLKAGQVAFSWPVHLIVEQNANDRLQRQATKLAVENSRLREAKLENIRLRLLLDFEQESLFGLFPAKVIGWDADRTVNSILINIGEGDGVREGMPVLTPDGLVGKVYHVMPAMSVVQLLLDRNCRVSAIVQRSRALGIVEWERGHQCFLRKIPARSDVKEGDVVVTSGMGGVFPKGLVIGSVSRVGGEKWELFRNIIVKPGVDFTNVEEVFVLTHEEYAQPAAGDSSVTDSNDTR